MSENPAPWNPYLKKLHSDQFLLVEWNTASTIESEFN